MYKYIPDCIAPNLRYRLVTEIKPLIGEQFEIQMLSTKCVIDPTYRWLRLTYRNSLYYLEGKNKVANVV